MKATVQEMSTDKQNRKTGTHNKKEKAKNKTTKAYHKKKLTPSNETLFDARSIL